MGLGPSWSDILDAVVGKKQRNQPRTLEIGDIASVRDGLLNRYGVWTGKMFIQYAKNVSGKRAVHEVSFRDFSGGADSLAICEFPKRYGHPKERMQPIVAPSSIVMPPDKLWRLIAQGAKAKKYKVYSPEETVARAKSRIGDTDFLTSEHFAMWCKTGIAESHQLEKLREWWDMIVVY